MSLIAKESGLSFMIWIFMGCMLALGAIMDSSFGEFLPFRPHLTADDFHTKVPYLCTPLRPPLQAVAEQ
jgi:hypothetical protein